MPSAEIFLCAEEKIVGFFVFEHSIDRGNRRYADGSGRQSCVAVGVVGAVGGEHVVQDSPDGEIAYGVFDSRVGLERHANAEPVEIDGRYVGLFFLGIGFLFYNGGNGKNLLAGETEVLKLELTFIPEIVGFAFHTVEECFGRGGPVEFIGVLQKHAYNGLRSLSVVLTDVA